MWVRVYDVDCQSESVKIVRVMTTREHGCL